MVTKLLFLTIFAPVLAFATDSKLNCAPDFPYQNGWLGADAVYSIPLSDSRDLWIFQDTFVGAKTQKTRSGSEIISNSIGISECKGGNFKIDYIWRSMHSENPRPYFESRSSEFRYWPVHGFSQNGKLFIFLIRVATTSDDQFGFKYVGVDLAKIEKFDSDAREWKVQIFEVSSDKTTFPGVSVVKRRGEVLVFAVLDGEENKSRDLVLARLLVKDIERNQFELEYLSKSNEWRKSLPWKLAKKVMKGGSTELSIHFDALTKKWIAIQTVPEFLTRNAMVRFADSPLGPWSSGKSVISFNEMEEDPDTFCYAAKAHSQFSKPGTALITYVCNSSNFGKQVNNMSIYRPVVNLKTLGDLGNSRKPKESPGN